MFDFEEKAPGEATISLLTSLCEKLKFAREAEDAAKEVLKEKSAIVDKIEMELKNYLTEYTALNGKFHTKYGTVSLMKRMGVKVPKGEELMEFFDYLEKRGAFEELATVNSNSLNSWYKSELQAREAEGNYDTNIPGLGAPTQSTFIKFKAE